MYIPDSWVILETQSFNNIFYKVLAGWSGGYLYGGSWRMNSGISKIEEIGDFYLFHGNSGSTYKCHKHSYGLCMETNGVFNKIKERNPEIVTLMNHTTDWIELLGD